MTYEGPRPENDLDSAPFWEGANDGKLMIQRCGKTGQSFLYSRGLTKDIDETSVEWVASSGKGEIYSFTICRVPSDPFFADQVPYAVGSVTLEEGARVLGRLITDDLDAIAVGQQVEVDFDRLDDDLAVPVFRITG